MRLLLDYVLQIADNALIHGHRLSEWCGHGPVLEQDIALTNTALDHIGQARSLYQYAADIYNQLDGITKQEAFASYALEQKKTDVTEDDLAYLRDAWDFKNALLLELPNKDWAYTMAKCFLYDQFTTLFYEALQKSTDVTLAAIANKSLKEVTYHKKWSSEWMIRMGDGTEVSNAKIQEALNDYCSYFGDFFAVSAADANAIQQGFGVDILALQPLFMSNVQEVIDEATLTLKDTTWQQLGGKVGQHTENLGFALAEMQFLQRTYPNMEW